MRIVVASLLGLALALVALGPAASQERLRVGVPDRPPFAMRVDEGSGVVAHEGIAVDLWRMIAEELRLSYDYVEVPRDGAARALASGEADLVLAVDATPKLEAEADLTQPLYTATLGVAADRSSRILTVLRGFASWHFLRLVLAISALLLAVGATIWLLERRHNKDQFNRSPLKGLGDGFWWAGVTLTTIGYGDKAPITVLGRAVAMVWMLVGLAVSAALTAAIVTIADVGDRTAEDLQGRTVATIQDSTAAAYLERTGADARLYPDAAAALRALDDDEVEAVALPAPMLRQAVKDADSTRRVRTTRLDPHYVTIALPEGSDLREPIDRALLRLLASDAGRGVIERYLPPDE